MICKLFGVFLSVLLFLTFSFRTLDARVQTEKPELELGGFFSAITYKEPGIMQDAGTMVGFNATRTWKITDLVVVDTINFDIRAGIGKMDYSSPQAGSITGIKNTLFESRARTGKSFMFGRLNEELLFYYGLGYRRLIDMSGGMISTKGYLGYDRESQYIYMPVGIEYYRKINHEWSVNGVIEYDIFLKGIQTSYMTDLNNISYSYDDDVVNHQNKGYGFRIAAKFMNDTVSFEPYFRYWNIGISDYDYVTFDSPLGSQLYRVWEPSNNSTEIGINISALF